METIQNTQNTFKDVIALANIVEERFDGMSVMVDNTAYQIKPPTIERIAGAAFVLFDVPDSFDISDEIAQKKNLENASKALAWFVCDEKETNSEMEEEVLRLSEILAKGSLSEILTGLSIVYSLFACQVAKKAFFQYSQHAVQYFLSALQ